ncbi:hypothetical protein [Haloarcula salinisoli]|uniref:Uncharacterized protein n=1 Tax=Haloarcula salinisoli TaxID=2487746 RepID=A0A8J7YDX7_9EURY|nr:hypothetical protein [Halomicroarcula salinisoli]MBX0303722.1 hypothetical protein [Halomicroarcula salinisoli]
MKVVNDFKLAIRRPNGDIQEIEVGQAVHPDSVESVIIPFSAPWSSSGPEVREVPLQEVAGQERPMGQETIYNGIVEEDVPNARQTFKIIAELSEYPSGSMTLYQLRHTEQVSYADISDLVGYSQINL